jgi:hypothetical protein
MPVEYGLVTDFPLSNERLGLALESIQFRGTLLSIRNDEIFQVVNGENRPVCTLFRQRPLALETVAGYTGSTDGKRLWVDVTVPPSAPENAHDTCTALAEALGGHLLERDPT